MVASSGFTIRAREADDNATRTIVDVTDEFTRVVPVLESRAGLTWERMLGGVAASFSAGVEFANWFGAIDTIKFVDPNHEGNTVERASDLGLFAYFAALELRR